MERKIILLVRVSSDKQDTKAQRDELVLFAKQAGYSIREMDIIRNVESATKKEELKGLDELKKDIDRYPIKHIYVWELSRISRRYDVLEEIRDLCIDRKINLTTKLERLTLLNADGSVNDDALEAFERYKMQVHREGKIRDARVKRGIMKAASQGRFLGGKDVLFGYMVDKNKHYQLEPEESIIVKEIFDLYETGKHSFSTIEKEILSKYTKQLDRKNLGRILNNPYYIGEKIKKDGYMFERQYPAIITKETFDNCQTLLKQRSNRKSDKSKNIYYASRLIKCSCCGSTLVAFGVRNNYACKNFHEKRGCKNGTSINLNIADSLALNVAFFKDILEIANFNLDKIKEVENNIIEIQSKINLANDRIEVIRLKYLKNYSKQFKNILPQKDIDELIEKTLKVDKLQIDIEITNYKNEIQRLNNYLKSKKNKSGLMGIVEETSNIIKNYNIQSLTDKQRYELTHQYIKNIQITDDDNNVKLIEVITYCDEVAKFKYYAKQKDNNKKLTELKTIKHVSKYYPCEWDKYIIERFKRK